MAPILFSKSQSSFSDLQGPPDLASDTFVTLSLLLTLCLLLCSHAVLLADVKINKLIKKTHIHSRFRVFELAFLLVLISLQVSV